MARICTVCGKGKMSGNLVSHSNRKTPTAWKPNVQKLRIKDGNGFVNAYVCTRCLKSGKVER